MKYVPRGVHVSAADAAAGPAAECRRLAGDYLGALARRHPDVATELGDHRFDDRLPDHGAEALDDERHQLDGFAARLGAVDPPGLGPELRVDAAVLANDVAWRLFALTELREPSWNPLVANPGGAVYTLLARDY